MPVDTSSVPETTSSEAAAEVSAARIATRAAANFAEAVCEMLDAQLSLRLEYLAVASALFEAGVVLPSDVQRHRQRLGAMLDQSLAKARDAVAVADGAAANGGKGVDTTL